MKTAMLGGGGGGGGQVAGHQPISLYNSMGNMKISKAYFSSA